MKAMLFSTTPTTPIAAMESSSPVGPVFFQEKNQSKKYKPGQHKPQAHKWQLWNVSDGHLDRHGVGSQEKDRKQQRSLCKRSFPVFNKAHGHKLYARAPTLIRQGKSYLFGSGLYVRPRAICSL